MPLWKWDKDRFHKLDFSNKLNKEVVIVGSGPSLNDVDVDSLYRCGKIIVSINRACFKVEPHIWVTMDAPRYWHPPAEVWDGRFVKIVRGNFAEEKIGDQMLKTKPHVLFADIDGSPPENSFNTENKSFGWGQRNSMLAALSIVTWMGAKRISLLGCDLGGNQAHFNVKSPICEKDRIMFEQIKNGLKSFVSKAKENGVEVISSTPGSPINEIMPYKMAV